MTPRRELDPAVHHPQRPRRLDQIEMALVALLLAGFAVRLLDLIEWRWGL